ncbi:restriction endonuclease subunit S [Limnohabitans sp. 2KL-3]|uniref:restriction endonuclease subunit S n=1 Tax=Limnohabitans sp. 2KL-3 TaxID=1100700 RepID=UPI000B075CF2|nr:restriction endonuclease subunit S [Limnohabitans sp. 2KL-3]
MKAGWQIKPLGELCDILDNRRKPVTKSDRIAGPYPYYGATGIQDFVSDFIFDEPLVLVGEDGAKWESGENTAFPIEGKCWVNNHAHVLRPIRERLIDNWLIYFLNHSDLTEYVSGLTVPKLNQGSLREIRIPLAPMEEQRRIVTLLDEAFADIATAKANAEKNLQNARELFTRISGSVLAQYAKTSQEITLEALVEPDCSLSYGIVQPGDEVADGLHIVRPVDMTTDVVMLDGLKRIDPALANSYARTTLKGNDILLCVRGTTGTVALAHSELAGANVTRGIVPIRFDPAKLSQQFGYYLLRSEPAQLQIQAKTYGTALQQINIRDLRQLTLPVPAPQDQEVIVQRLSALEEETKQLTAAYENKLTALDDLKKSLLHQAFSGQLTQ